MKRPLCAVCLLYVGGILAAEFIRLPFHIVLALAVILAFGVVAWPRARLLLLHPLIVAAGLANALLHTAIISPVDVRNVFRSESHLVTVSGKLCETPVLRVSEQQQPPSWRTMAKLELSSFCPAKGSWRPVFGSVVITTPGVLTNLFSGQLVEVTGVLAPPRPAVAEGTFDYRQYLRRLGIYYQLQAESEKDWRVVASPPALPLADRFSAWARHALALGLPHEDESLRLEWALALGWKTALTEQTSEPFVRAATYHIFAVDGLRMAIVFGIFFGLLRACGLPRAICGLVLIPLIWFYVALTGWPASAIRATVMLTIIIIGWALKRPSDPLNSLFAAALIILIWEPQQLFQAGFQLSFFVVLCLILIIPPLFDLLKRITEPDPMLPEQLRRHWHPVVRIPTRYVADLLVTSFAAWIGSIPLVAYYFNILTPVSTPANIVAVPLCVLVLISNLLSLSLAGWAPWVAELFNHAGWFCMESIRVSSQWFEHWPAAYCYVAAPSLGATCLYYGLLLAFLTGWAFRPSWRPWKIAVLGLPVVIWAWNCCQHLPAPRLTILPVHGGTSVYYDAFGTKNDLLIDIGSTNSVDFITKPFLRAQGVNRSPALVLSHGDIHHMGGVEPFLEAFSISRIYTSPVRFRSAPYRRILTRLAKAPGLLNPTGRGQIVGNWKILHPDPSDRYGRADDGAVVLKGVVRGTSILLLSDLGRAGQADLLRRTEDLRAEIVVTGLPTADEPLSEELLRAICPKLIIISDSELPISERASPKLRERLDHTGLAVVYTRGAGAVTLDFARGSWRLHSAKGLILSSTDPNLTSAAKQFQATRDSRLTQPGRRSNVSESPTDIESTEPRDANDG